MKRDDLLKKIRKHNDEYLPKSNQPIGAVYDSSSSDDHLPVALIIGINYGQCKTAAGSVVDHQEELPYSRYVRDIAKEKKLSQQDYHVVLWNFYPYLTEREWLEEVTTSSLEAVKIFDEGYPDPFTVFKKLVDSLQPELLVFHGVTSAVPLLARFALRDVRRDGFSVSTYLVDNLARGLKKNKLRAII